MSDDGPTTTPMLYELWEYDDGHAFVVRDKDDAKYRHHFKPALAGESNVQMTRTIEAATYNEAMQALYD